MKIDSRLVAAQSNHFLHFDGADRSEIAQPDSHIIRVCKGLRSPFSGPKFSVIGITFTFNDSDFIIGKQFVPAPAPNIIVAGIRREASGANPGIVPQQLGIEGFVSNLPDLGSGLRKYREPQEPIFEGHNS